MKMDSFTPKIPKSDPRNMGTATAEPQNTEQKNKGGRPKIKYERISMNVKIRADLVEEMKNRGLNMTRAMEIALEKYLYE